MSPRRAPRSPPDRECFALSHYIGLTVRFQLVTGRTWKGSAFGGVKGRSELPGIVDDYLDGKLWVDEFVTHHQTLENINKGFDDMHVSGLTSFEGPTKNRPETAFDASSTWVSLRRTRSKRVHLPWKTSTVPPSRACSSATCRKDPAHRLILSLAAVLDLCRQ